MVQLVFGVHINFSVFSVLFDYSKIKNQIQQPRTKYKQQKTEKNLDTMRKSNGIDLRNCSQTNRNRLHVPNNSKIVTHVTTRQETCALWFCDFFLRLTIKSVTFSAVNFVFNEIRKFRYSSGIVLKIHFSSNGKKTSLHKQICAVPFICSGFFFCTTFIELAHCFNFIHNHKNTCPLHVYWHTVCKIV